MIYKKLTLFLLLITLQSHAFDLNDTNEIITKASQATVEIQNEIESVITDESIEKEAIIIDENIFPEANVSKDEMESIVTDNLIAEEAIVALDENITQESNISKKDMDENNSIPAPTIESVLLIEENLTAEVNSSIVEENTTKLNKETFDMSKGSLEKGEEIYKKRLKKICDTNKSELSEHYSQDEWEAFASEGKFENAIFEICPQIEPSYNKEWSADLYQFYYQNARDSEEIPEC